MRRYEATTSYSCGCTRQSISRNNAKLGSFDAPLLVSLSKLVVWSLLLGIHIPPLLPQHLADLSKLDVRMCCQYLGKNELCTLSEWRCYLGDPGKTAKHVAIQPNGLPSRFNTLTVKREPNTQDERARCHAYKSHSFVSHQTRDANFGTSQVPVEAIRSKRVLSGVLMSRLTGFYLRQRCCVIILLCMHAYASELTSARLACENCMKAELEEGKEKSRAGQGRDTYSWLASRRRVTINTAKR